MNAVIREYTEGDIEAMCAIWNEVIDGGVAFPQLEKLDHQSALDFFSAQSFTAVAVRSNIEDSDTDEPLGLYILHPNNVGRCGHISNASYAVTPEARGGHIGEKLVRHSIEKARELGFKLLQFNAVVKTNHAARHLYEKLGFVELGTIPDGFLMKDGNYEDIVLFYYTL